MSHFKRDLVLPWVKSPVQEQPMWIIYKEFTFEAAHQLPHHEGKCRRLHGHSFRGRVYVMSDRLHNSGSETGMVMDFSR